MVYQSYIERFEAKLSAFHTRLDDHLSNSEIRPVGIDEIVGAGKTHFWVDNDLLLTERQGLHKQLNELAQIADRVLDQKFSETSGAWAKAAGEIEEWLVRSGRLGAVPGSIDLARDRSNTLIASLRDAVKNSLLIEAAVHLVLISDTNVYETKPHLEDHFELAGYPRPADQADRTVAFIPHQVLAELDKNKDKGKEWAKKATTRLKGLRNQGNIVDGVPMVRRCLALGEAMPPKVQDYSADLDPERGDDRILCSVMAAESLFPESPVVFLTRDGNAATKAAFLGLNCIEPE